MNGNQIVPYTFLEVLVFRTFIVVPSSDGHSLVEIVLRTLFLDFVLHFDPNLFRGKEEVSGPGIGIFKSVGRYVFIF